MLRGAFLFMYPFDGTFAGIVHFFDVAPDATPPVVLAPRSGAPVGDAFVSANLPIDTAALEAAALDTLAVAGRGSTTDVVSAPLSLASSHGS